MTFSKYVRYVIGDTPGAVRIDMLPEKFVVDDVDLRALGLKKLPDLRGWTVRGNFDCSWNELTELDGIPGTIGGNFNCSHNQLTSLRNAPEKIGGKCDCSYNKLENLDDLPKEIGGKVISRGNLLPQPKKDFGHIDGINDVLFLNPLRKIKSWFKFGNER